MYTIRMNRSSAVAWAVAIALLPALAALAASPRFSVVLPMEQSATPLDGRLLLVDDSPNSQMVFGVDVDGLRPGQAATVDEHAFGYPVRSLADLKPGEYYVQAVLHRYETFHRADGHTVKLPMDRGEGQHWNLAPGNLYSTPQKIGLGGAAAAAVRIVLDRQI